MANETYVAELMEVRIKVEATYGTDATPAATDVCYVEEFEFNYNEEMIELVGASPQGKGFGDVAGASWFEVSGTTHLDIPTISSADSTDLPKCYPFFYGGQWKLSSDAASKTHTLTLGTQAGQGVTVYARDYNSAENNGQVRKIVGCQWATSLTWEAGQIVKVGFDGMAKGAATPSDVIANLGSGPVALTYPAITRVIAAGATIKIQNLSNNAIYGGGSLSSPTQGLAISSFAFESGVSAERVPSACATGATHAINASRLEHATVKMGLEVTDLDEFDPYELRHDGQAMGIRVEFFQGSNKVCFYCNGKITTIESAVVANKRFYDITFKCIYFEDAADGTPAAGLAPQQGPKAGTNEGLYADPSSIPAAIAAIQFQTV